MNPGLAHRESPSPLRQLAVCVGLALAACAPWQTEAPVSAVSYQTSREQLPRTVGKLRRLAVLQVRMVPGTCAGGSDGLPRLTGLDATARELLAARKGYELLEPDALHPLAGIGNPVDPASTVLAAELMSARDPAQPPGPTLRAWLDRLRESERVDGVLALKQEVSCLGSSPATRGLMALFSFGVSELVGLDAGQPVAEYLEAVVFEAATSRMVWRSVYGRLEQELVKPPLPATAGPQRLDGVRAWSITHVLQDIEPAVPRLLTR